MGRVARDVTMAMVVVKDDIFPEQGAVKPVGMEIEERFSLEIAGREEGGRGKKKVHVERLEEKFLFERRTSKV